VPPSPRPQPPCGQPPDRVVASVVAEGETVVIARDGLGGFPLRPVVGSSLQPLASSFIQESFPPAPPGAPGEEAAALLVDAAQEGGEVSFEAAAFEGKACGISGVPLVADGTLFQACEAEITTTPPWNSPRGDGPQAGLRNSMSAAAQVMLSEDAGPQDKAIFTLTGLHAPKRETLAEKLASRSRTMHFGPLARLLAVISAALVWGESIKEPERKGRLARFINSSHFKFLCVACIGCNALFIMYTTDYEMRNLGEKPTDLILNVEFGFMLFYLVELLLKLAVHRLYFFGNAEMAWNIFDTFLVLFSIMELSMAYIGEHSAGGLNLSFMRAMRLFKVAKVLRVFRTFRFFTELRLMLDCVLGSFISLFWCMLLLLFVLYGFALLLVQGLTQTLLRQDFGSTDDYDGDLSADIADYFGSVAAAMATLLQSTTNGIDWRIVYNALVQCGTLVTTVYLFYILFFAIAAWNIITSTFIDRALKLAQPDLETLIREQHAKDVIDGEQMVSLFKGACLSDEDNITQDEFKKMTEDAKFRSYLHVRGIDINNAELFFDMLQVVGGGEVVNIQVLVSALLRMKGFATSIDLHSLSFETKVLSRRQQIFMHETNTKLQAIKELMAALNQAVQAPRRTPLGGAHQRL